MVKSPVLVITRPCSLPHWLTSHWALCLKLESRDCPPGTHTLEGTTVKEEAAMLSVTRFPGMVNNSRSSSKQNKIYSPSFYTVDLFLEKSVDIKDFAKTT